MLKISLFICLALLGILLLRSLFFSFSAQRPADYAAATPKFDVKKSLSGEMISEGMIYGPTGKVVSRFVAKMDGRWSGNTGILVENFAYDSGKNQRREWRLQLLENGKIRGTAADIIGTAEGEVQGSALRLAYRIELPKDAGGHVLDVVDWLYLMPNGTILNRSQMGRLGITAAELIATIRPAS